MPKNKKVDEERILAAQARYEAAAHAMMAGVSLMMNYDPETVSAKQLKVAANSAQVSVAALGAIMIDKGLITPEEYYEGMAKQMETEARDYEKMVKDHLGTEAEIKLA